MSHSLTTRGAKTRRRILEAAADLFHRKGVSATSVDQVLEAAGAGKSQFYHYFKSKDDLVCEVVRHHTEVWLESGPTAEELSEWSGISAWLGRTLSWQRGARCCGCPVGSMVGELAAAGSEIRKSLDTYFCLLERNLAAGLVALKKRGDLSKSADPQALAELTVATVQGALLITRSSKDIDKLERILAGALESLQSHGSG